MRVRASTSAKDFWCRVRDSAEVSHDGNVKRNDAAFDPLRPRREPALQQAAVASTRQLRTHRSFAPNASAMLSGGVPFTLQSVKF